MNEPGDRQFQWLAFLWPALAAAAARDGAALIAKQFAGLAMGPDDGAPPREPVFATPNTIALELKAVRLRDFSAAQEGPAALVCAPFALHGAAIADLAPGHSLVAALLAAGLRRLFLADWRSAEPDMRFRGIDDYLADLNILVDRIGGRVDLIGLCQGGWLALLYAARFPGKVRKLAIAGAPIDIAAAPSRLSMLTDANPLALFHELVEFGDGRVLGHRIAQFWGVQTIDRAQVHAMLQTPEPIDSPAFARLEAAFRVWDAWTFDLPGTYYLEVVEKLYKRNALAAGEFVALGQPIDLSKVRIPLFLLAARDDELVAPAQLFAAEHLVGTLAQRIDKALAPCRHLGLFMGRDILGEYWPRIVQWMLAQETPQRPSTRDAPKRAQPPLAA
jgi:poly(3-hydroxybutyrate) depolymerase